MTFTRRLYFIFLGAYNITDPWSETHGLRGPQAPFKSTTARCASLNKTSVENPGPGAYNPYERNNSSDNRKTFP